MLYPVELRALTPELCTEPAWRVTTNRENLVGVEGFEPPTSCSQSRRATRLRYTPVTPDPPKNADKLTFRAGVDAQLNTGLPRVAAARAVATNLPVTQAMGSPMWWPGIEHSQLIFGAGEPGRIR